MRAVGLGVISSGGSALVFGAGNVGRGLLGDVFTEAGMSVTFVDVDKTMVEALNRDGGYPHLTVDDTHRHQRQIRTVTALHPSASELVARAVREATVIATCVGVRALPDVCRQIAPMISARLDTRPGTLNLLIAENLHDAATEVRTWLLEAAPTLRDPDVARRVGVVATSIGRMIPQPRPAIQQLGVAAIEVEPYRFLPLDGEAIRGDFPMIPAVVSDRAIPFAFYAERKLWLHNMGHAMVGYLGLLGDDSYVWETCQRPGIRAWVRNAMVESAVALAARYHRPLGPLLDHIDDLLHRFTNRALGDPLVRVARDPDRKLASDDRLLGAYRNCQEHGVDPRHVVLGIAAAGRQLARERHLDDAAILDLLRDRGCVDPRLPGLLAAMAGARSEGRIEQLLASAFRESRIP
ncbi:MAG: hypothetical protein ACK5LN_04295 [Propioniciclava sp.]